MQAALPWKRLRSMFRRGISVALGAIACSVPALALTPVPNFDLDRYYGVWYEIAAIRGFLQSRCARDTRTEYSAGENGAMILESKCLRADGTPERSEARARPLDRALPSVLKITSVHFLGIWWYPLGRESIVVARAPDGRWLTVGHPSLRYARILARDPALSDADLTSASAALTEAGFDLCSVMLTAQTAGRQQPSRLCDRVRAPASTPGPAALQQ